MTRVLTTLAAGRYFQYLDIVRSSFWDYAHRHGYEFIESWDVDESRPASWSKIPLLLALLDEADEVLWVDCDAVIVDSSRDLAAHVPPDAWQAMTILRQHGGFAMGEVPSCGLWLVRQPMIPVLYTLWDMTQYINHPWWENAAMHELLGYTYSGAGIFPVQAGPETELRRNTYFLPDGWQSTAYDDATTQTMVMHVPGMVAHGERLRLLRGWATRASVEQGVAWPQV